MRVFECLSGVKVYIYLFIFRLSFERMTDLDHEI